MAEAHEQFFPDDVDVQIEACRQGSLFPSIDNQLIRDLYRFYREDEYIIYSVWERLASRMPQGIPGSLASFLSKGPDAPEG